MGEVCDVSSRLSLQAVKERRKWSSVQGGLLRLAHFGRGDHLHGFGDLGGVANGPDTPADVAHAAHTESPGCKVLRLIMQPLLRVSAGRLLQGGRSATFP